MDTLAHIIVQDNIGITQGDRKVHHVTFKMAILPDLLLPTSAFGKVQHTTMNQCIVRYGRSRYAELFGCITLFLYDLEVELMSRLDQAYDDFKPEQPLGSRVKTVCSEYGKTLYEVQIVYSVRK